jgi:hypothetical protein
VKGFNDNSHRSIARRRTTPKPPKKTLQNSAIIRLVEKAFDVEFLDAAQYAEPSKADCIHMDADSHEKLANAIYKKVLDILGAK